MPPCEGRKNDSDKPRWWLLPIEPMVEIVKVLTYGANKYEDENWKKVPNARERYYSAMLRHVTAWRTGEPIDPEWGLHHLAHAGCCLLFLLWFELTQKEETDERPC